MGSVAYLIIEPISQYSLIKLILLFQQLIDIQLVKPNANFTSVILHLQNSNLVLLKLINYADYGLKRDKTFFNP